MTGFDCSQCLARCKADCCRGPVPMPKALLAMFPVVRPIVFQREMGDGLVMVLANDETGSTTNPKVLSDGGPGAPTIYGCCPFLGHDNRCSIYEHRPGVCREFGSESSPFMTCSYQAADGRVRERPERRRIERVVFAKRDAALKRMGASAEDRAAMGKRLGVVTPRRPT